MIVLARRVVMASMLAVAGALLVTACSDDSNSGTSGGGGIPCKLEKGSDDCQGQAGKTAKFDCGTRDNHAKAIAAGCVEQDPGDTTDVDVCCSPSTTEQAPTSESGTVPCVVEAKSDDCQGNAGKTLKFDCGTRGNHAKAIAAGCIEQDPGDTTDVDVCCPPTFKSN